MVQRIADPMAEPWGPPEGAVRIHFETSYMRGAAGIPPNLSSEADDRYFAFLSGLASEGIDLGSVRATTYRYGPMTGGDPAFLDLLLKGAEVVAAAASIVSLSAWLKAKGALEIRVSEAGIETLGRWEIKRRGGAVAEVLSIGLMPGQGETPWGTPRQWGGYATVFRLQDGRLATLVFALDGVLQEFAIADGETGR